MSSLQSELKPRRGGGLVGGGGGGGSVHVAVVLSSRGGAGISPTSLVSTEQPTPMSLVRGRTERRLGPGLWSGLVAQPLVAGWGWGWGWRGPRNGSSIFSTSR